MAASGSSRWYPGKVGLVVNVIKYTEMPAECVCFISGTARLSAVRPSRGRLTEDGWSCRWCQWWCWLRSFNCQERFVFCCANAVVFWTFNPLMPTVAMWVQLKHPVPDRIKPSFVIFDIRALWRSGLSVTVPGCQKLQMTA